MVRNQQAWVLFHEGHQQNKNNDKTNILAMAKMMKLRHMRKYL